MCRGVLVGLLVALCLSLGGCGEPAPQTTGSAVFNRMPRPNSSHKAPGMPPEPR